MKNILKLGAILFIVTALAGGGLAVVNAITKPQIEMQKKIILQQSLTAVLPMANSDAIEPTTIDGFTFYRGFQSNDRTKLVGYAIAVDGKGYSGNISTLVGVDTLLQITGIIILKQSETPGLGTKITEIKYGATSPWFQDQFINRSWKQLVVDKDGGEITSITGATISSRAVTQSVHASLQRLESLIAKIPPSTEN
jgi:Na+-translocating ferredoxin:NAD+ oxidoreductase subunit G